MNRTLLAIAGAMLFAVSPALADTNTGPSTPQAPATDGSQVPGSESPTKPATPGEKPIPPGNMEPKTESGGSGASSGVSGTAGPYNPARPAAASGSAAQ